MSLTMQGMFFAEAWMTELAPALGQPQHLIRELNFYPDNSTTHYGQLLDNSQVTVLRSLHSPFQIYNDCVLCISYFTSASPFVMRADGQRVDHHQGAGPAAAAS